MQALNSLIFKHKLLAAGGQEQVGDGDALDLLFAGRLVDKFHRKVAGQNFGGKAVAVNFREQVLVVLERHFFAGDERRHQNVGEGFGRAVFLQNRGGQALRIQL